MAANIAENIVSVIVPVYNGEDFIEECLNSILKQDLHLSPNEKLHVEICIFEDGSIDNTLKIISELSQRLQESNDKNFSIKLLRNESGAPKGVGYGRNMAIAQSSGNFLCFCDADDVMLPNRLITQYKLAMDNLDAIVGSRYRRCPENSTQKFTQWANMLNTSQLYTQIFLSFGPTLVMPTWFCHRSVYNKIHGGFDETRRGAPEDLIFFYKHLNAGGKLVKADEVLMIYRYHPNATTFSVSEEAILNIRILQIQDQVLSKWPKFTIWNAGKQGRKFFRSLKLENQEKVMAFCDVDFKKINQKFYNPYPLQFTIPIVHVNDAQAPFIICVKTELTWEVEGSFRRLLQSLKIQEGVDFYYFN